MSLLLIKPEFDIWEPGEHTGTLGEINWLSLGTAALEYREIPILNRRSKLKSFLESF